MDHGRGLDLLLCKVALPVVLQGLGKKKQAVERRSKLVGHVGQELGLVLARDGQLLGLSLDLLPRLLQLPVLALDLALLALQGLGPLLELLVGDLELLLLGSELFLGLLEKLGLLLQLLVGSPQLLLLGLQLLGLLLQLLGLLLRLLEQPLRAVARLHCLDCNGHALGNLLHELHGLLAEPAYGAELDHTLDLAAENQGHDQDVFRTRVPQARDHLHVVLGHAGEQDGLLFQRGLAHQALAHLELVGQALSLFIRVPAHHAKNAVLASRENRPDLRSHVLCEVRKDAAQHVRHRPVPPHQAGHLGLALVEPVASRPLVRGLAKVLRHLAEGRAHAVVLAAKRDLCLVVAQGHLFGQIHDLHLVRCVDHVLHGSHDPARVVLQGRDRVPDGHGRVPAPIRHRVRGQRLLFLHASCAAAASCAAVLCIDQFVALFPDALLHGLSDRLGKALVDKEQVEVPVDHVKRRGHGVEILDLALGILVDGVDLPGHEQDENQHDGDRYEQCQENYPLDMARGLEGRGCRHLRDHGHLCARDLDGLEQAQHLDPAPALVNNGIAALRDKGALAFNVKLLPFQGLLRPDRVPEDRGLVVQNRVVAHAKVASHKVRLPALAQPALRSHDRVDPLVAALGGHQPPGLVALVQDHGHEKSCRNVPRRAVLGKVRENRHHAVSCLAARCCKPCF